MKKVNKQRWLKGMASGLVGLQEGTPLSYTVRPDLRDD